MARSFKKPYIKDKPRNSKKSSDYWRRIRTNQNQVVRQLKYDPTLEIPEEKTIVNDWDYEDYKYEIKSDNQYYNKATRK